MVKPKRTLKKEDVQLEIADYIRDHIADLDFVGGDKPGGSFSIVATIQLPLREYTGIGSSKVELCFTGEMISPIRAYTTVEVRADEELCPYVDSIKQISIRR